MRPSTITQQVNRAAAQANIPLSVFVEITRSCNLDCYYCYQKQQPPAVQLSAAAWDAALAELAEAGSLYVTFSGGEPFVRPDFLDIVGHSRRRGFAVSIITNGTRVGEREARALSALGVMDVGVSFLAAHAPLHDRLCGVAGSFERAVGAIRLLVKEGVRVLIKHSASSANQGEYQGLLRMAEDEGCFLECDTTILPHEQGAASPFTLDRGRHAALLADLGAAPLSSGDDPDGRWALHCDAGRSLCGIAADGEVFPCILLAVPFGNCSRHSFREVWNGEAAQAFRREEARLDDACEHCGRRRACSRCHAVAFMESGAWNGKSPSLCERAEAVTLCAKSRTG
jgi:radical SAM protein with 4Fe4S-binding SPASM domain